MPYRVIKNDNGTFSVMNTRTGHVLAKNTTKTNADSEVRLLRGITDDEEYDGVMIGKGFGTMPKFMLDNFVILTQR